MIFHRIELVSSFVGHETLWCERGALTGAPEGAPDHHANGGACSLKSQLHGRTPRQAQVCRTGLMPALLSPDLVVTAAGTLPILTFTITYCISISNGHLQWTDGVTLSQSIASAPERFVGTFGLSLTCCLVFLASFIRKVYCDQVLGETWHNLCSLGLAWIGTLGTLGVASVQCGGSHGGSTAANWHQEVHGQCFFHFIAAYACFLGFVAYINHQTFYIDRQIAAVILGYGVPWWKKVLTVLPVLFLFGMITLGHLGLHGGDLCEVAMIGLALVWMVSLRGTFNGLQFKLQFEGQPDPRLTHHDGLGVRLVT